MSDTGDRTHAATPMRLERARSDGDVARSAELAFSIQLCCVVGIVWLLAGNVGHWLGHSTITTWSSATIRADQFNAATAIQETTLAGLTAVAPILLLTVLAAVASWWLQTGPMWLAEKVAPDVSRLSPGNWFERSFSLSGMASLLIGVPRVFIAIAVAAGCTWIQRQQLASLASSPADQMFQQMLELVLTTAMAVGVALLLTSAADYASRRVSHQRRLRMSDQDLRDEQKMQGANNPMGAARTADK